MEHRKVAQPPWWQGVLCVLALLGLQSLLTWMDQASTEDLCFVLLVIPVGLVAGCIARRVREG